MVDLSLKRFDSHNMYDHINGFYRQLIEGADIGRKAALGDLDVGGIDNILLAGMGGSAIGGELLKSFLKAELKVPFIIHRNYGLPAIVGEKSLVICSSYSGNTEETISAFKAAVENNSKVLCITTGGELSSLAKSHSVPVVMIPPGMMPREALGYSFAPLLVLFGRLGLCRDYTEDIQTCAGILKNRSADYAFESDPNQAVDIAMKLKDKIAIIYSGPDYFDAVALRLKGQISENAKQHAFCNVFPEFNHNELVGWEKTPEITDKFVVLIIRDKLDHVQVARRMDIVKKLLEERGIEVLELKSDHEDLLARMFSLIQLGDYVTYYLALVNNIDPTPIDIIEYMKNQLSDNKAIQ